MKRFNHFFTNANDGDISISGYQYIGYTGLEPINSSINVADLRLTYSSPNAAITMSDAGSGQTRVESTAAETITFDHPTGNLFVYGSTGDEIFHITSLSANYPADIRFDGEGGNDTINLNGSVSTNNKYVALLAETVNISAPLSVGSGTIGIVADSVAISASISGSNQLGILPQTTSANIGIAGGSGTLNLTATELGYLSDGFSKVEIGDESNGTGTIDIGTSTFLDPVTLCGGTLNNSGSSITAPSVTLDGAVAPGQSPGILTVNGNFAFTDNSSFDVEIGGTTPGDAANNHDQIVVNGTVTIGSNVSLNTSAFNSFVPSAGDSFTIIDNDGADAISGTFASLAEGATVDNDFLGSGLSAVISYAGGDGNDVELYVLAEPIIDKEFSPTSITAGGTTTLTFTLTNPNVGTSLSGLNFTDTLPSGLEVATSPNLGGTCVTVAATNFTPNIAAGITGINLTSGITLAARESCTITVDLESTSAGTKVNTSGNVGSTETGSGTDNATATLNVSAPDLTATKTNNVSDATSLGNLVDGLWSWSIKVDNVGPDDATFSSGHKITEDNLPAGPTYGIPSISNSTDVTGTISCGILSNVLTCTASGGNVVVGDTNGTFTVSFTSTPTSTGAHVNPSTTCSVDPTGNVIEDNEANNACSDTVTVSAPDLRVSKSNNVSGTSSRGDLSDGQWTWTLTMTNVGGGKAVFADGETILTDYLPLDPTYGSVTVDAAGSTNITNPGNISCDIDKDLLSCTASGDDVTFGATTASISLSFTATPISTGANLNPTTTCAIDPNSKVTESNEGNNTCSDTVTVSVPDLTISKSNNVSNATSLGDINDGAWTWSVVVSNTGAGEAVFADGETIISDQLPVTNISYSDTKVTAQINAPGNISCAVDFNSKLLICIAGSAGLTIGATTGSVTITTTATPTAAGTFTNPTGGTCGVDPDGDVIESNESNNSCTANSVTVSAPDLSASKTNNVGGEVDFNGSWTWTTSITNMGTGEAVFEEDELIFSDDLPNTNISYGAVSTKNIVDISGTAHTLDCSVSSSTISCYPRGGTLIFGATTGRFDVAITGTPSVPATFDNPRSGGACGVDPNSKVGESDESNNSCSDSVKSRGPDLTATKSNDTSDKVTQNGTFNWEITLKNIGSQDAVFPTTTAILSDTLPTGATYGVPTIRVADVTNGDYIHCAIDASSILLCEESGKGSVTIGATTGEIVVTIPITDAGLAGDLANPVTSCSVDPTNALVEESETNNDCADTVEVTIAEVDMQRPAGTSIPDGGTDNLGDQSPGVVNLTYTVDNTLSTEQLSITAVDADNLINVSNFDLVTPLPIEVAAGAVGSFDISFEVDSLGDFSLEIHMPNNDPDESPYDIQIAGSGAAVPEIEIFGNDTSIFDGDSTPSPPDHTDFGSADENGATITRTFTIRNSGEAELNLVDPLSPPIVTISGTHAGDFALTSDVTVSTLNESEQTMFTITFNPSAQGIREANISIANNDGDENPFDFSIQGTGTGPAPEMDVLGNNVSIPDGDTSPSSLDQTDFGAVLVSNGLVTYTYTIENTGSVDLNLTEDPRITIGGAHAAEFTLASDAASTVANSGGTTTFEITFDPRGEELRQATVSIINDDADENPYEFNIQGTGVVPSGGNPATQKFNIGEDGGEFNAGAVTVIVPPGAVPNGTQLTIVRLPIDGDEGNIIIGDQVFDITFTGPNGEEITDFSLPIQIMFRPTTAQLRQAGFDLDNLHVLTRHGDEAWRDVPNAYNVDGYRCVDMWQFSDFGLGVAPLPETGFAPGEIHLLPEQPAEKDYFNVIANPERLTLAPAVPSAGEQSPHSAGDRVVAQFAPRDDNFILAIPALSLELPIVGVPFTEHGWDVTWLGDRAGYLEGTAFPTWAGNTAITAHVWDADNQPGPFIDLHTLKHGDWVEIHAFGKRYIYEVRDNILVAPDDLNTLAHSDFNILTLITCEGFSSSGAEYRYRRIVQAVLIKVE
ncbi:MAG: sortase [Anaerolineales bacterium]|nr:sortase [Chloroflexota bacterium]MBL6982358.1 sortase [Anaerolineales bacterium]